MKRLFWCAVIATFFLGSCGKSSKEEKQTKAAVTEKIVVNDDGGQYDPVARPKAVKGGEYVTWGAGFPKSLNMWLNYTALTKEVMGLLFESLVTLHSTTNVPVGGLAESWEISADKKTFTFKIHQAAHWSDGKPVTAEDVQFYYDVIMDPKNMTSLFRVDLKRLARPEIVDEKTLRTAVKEQHWSNFWTAAGLSAFPKHQWKDADFNEQNWEFPVVSGPYMVKEIKKNRYIALQRRTDWWGNVKMYNQYKYNFNTIKYRFMEDRNKVLEAFKTEMFDAYKIYTSSIWMKQTDFEAVQKGWVVRQRVYNKDPKSFQGFAINLRRDKFQDVRTRKALCHLLNRELMNEKLMYNQYYLLNSYYPDLYPNNVNPDFPVTAYDPEKARALLKEAGWEVGSNGMLQKNGEPFNIVFLEHSPSLIKHLNIYVEDLKKVGIDARIEQLSYSSIMKRVDNHDFDMVSLAWGAPRLRDPEPMWHSSTADEIASNNRSGVKDSFIDSLIEVQKTEMDIDKRNEIIKRIDNRLNEIVPYVLQWGGDHHRLLYWNRFGTPEYVLSKFGREEDIVTYWWFDPQKDAALQEAMKSKESIPSPSGDVRYTE